MKIKTSELTGAALDWAVASAQGSAWALSKNNAGTLSYDAGLHGAVFADNPDIPGRWHTYRPSTNWAQGGPIIEREFIHLHGGAKSNGDSDWCALRVKDDKSGCHNGHGPTPLIAAMRCFVASKLGDEVDVPEELV